MFHIVLYEPEIPPNTGNIIRLCANIGSHLHLIHPLGFNWDHQQLQRAGLDYHEFAEVTQYIDFHTFLREMRPERLFGISTRGKNQYNEVSFQSGDAFLFGPETRGLPQTILDKLPRNHCLRIPMRPGQRCLNLSNGVAIVLYEAWRQLDFLDGE